MNQFVLSLRRQHILSKKAKINQPVYGFSGVGFVFPLMAPVSITAAGVSFFTSGAAGTAVIVSFVSAFSDSELLLQLAMRTHAKNMAEKIRGSFVLFCLIILVVLEYKFTIFFQIFQIII